MLIKMQQFCSLATSPSFQTWLFNYNQQTYRLFINDLQKSHGCGENRELMKVLVKIIDDNGGGPKLVEFLSKHYPHMVDNNIVTNNISDIFPNYNPNILTYPRRIIFTGSKKQLQKRIREFLLDKIKSDHLIIKDIGYVEYLNKEDKHIANKVPIENWLIGQHRNL